MKRSRWASLLLVACVGLSGQRADAMRTPLADVRAAITQPHQLTAATAASDQPADVPNQVRDASTWIVESIIPLGTTADGQPLALISFLVPLSSLDELPPTSTRAGPYAAPKTHTRVFCIVQPPLGLAPTIPESASMDLGTGATSIKFEPDIDAAYKVYNVDGMSYHDPYRPWLEARCAWAERANACLIGGGAVIAAAPVVLPAVKGAVDTGSIYVYFKAVEPVAVKIAASSGFGWATARLITGISSSNPQVYGARFQAYGTMARMSSRLGADRLTRFFRGRQVAQGYADQAAYVHRAVETMRAYGVKILEHEYHPRVGGGANVTHSGDWVIKLDVYKDAFSKNTATLGISPNAVMAHEIGHLGQSAMLSEADRQVLASFAGADQPWLTKMEQQQLLIDTLFRLLNDGQPSR